MQHASAVGGGHRLADGELLDMDYFENGGPRVPDFHGGDENFRSVDYMAIPTAPMQTLATLIFDGVLQRLTVDESGGNVEPLAVTSGVVDGNDVGMPQLCSRPGFTQKPLDCLRSLHRSRLRNLERHLTVELGIISPVDRPERAAPQNFFNLETAEFVNVSNWPP